MYPKFFGKLFRKGEMLIGVCGSLRVAQVLRFGFKVPKHPEKMPAEEYLNTKFASALLKKLKAAGARKKENEVETAELGLLIAYRGRLFSMGGGFSVSESALGYDSTGSGSDYALGSLVTTEPLDVAPRDRLRVALKAAATFCWG